MGLDALYDGQEPENGVKSKDREPSLLEYAIILTITALIVTFIVTPVKWLKRRAKSQQ